MIENLLGTDKLTTVEPLRHCSVSPYTPPSRIRSRLDQISLNSWKTNFIIIYLTIILQVRIGCEMVDSQRGMLAIIISYPTSAGGIIIVLLKTPTKFQEFFLTLFVKTTNFQLVLNFEQTCTVTIFGEHGIINNNNNY